MLTAEEIKALRERTKLEMAKRNGYGDISEYGSSDYDFETIPEKGGPILAEQGKRIANPLLHVKDIPGIVLIDEETPDGELPSTTGSRVPSAFENITFTNALDEISTESMKSDKSSCRGACTGLCVGSCIDSCSGCGNDCGSTCTGCTGCTSCTGGCGSGCTGGTSSTVAKSRTLAMSKAAKTSNIAEDTISLDITNPTININRNTYSIDEIYSNNTMITNNADNNEEQEYSYSEPLSKYNGGIQLYGTGCSSCDTACAVGCGNICIGGCSGGCGSGCTNSCSVSCGGNTCTEICMVNCDSWCYESCGNSCNQACSTGCTGGCNGCSGCGGACSYGCSGCTGCSGGCQDNCAYNCTRWCGVACQSGCVGGCLGCSTTCKDKCGSGCVTDCGGECLSSCMQSCTENCYTTCTGQCFGSATGHTIINNTNSIGGTIND